MYSAFNSYDISPSLKSLSRSQSNQSRQSVSSNLTPTYSTFCPHKRVVRVDNNFMRCNDCGRSFVDQLNAPKIKTMEDFVREDSSFQRNFNRNFNNEIEQTESYGPVPIEYYVDKNFINRIIVKWERIYGSNPAKYTLTLNGNQSSMTDAQIRELIQNTRAIKISKEQYDQIIGI